MTVHINSPLPRLVAPGGPVSEALRIMREADPEMARIVELRRAIGDRIEADIALLDALMGDCDLEDGEDEPSLGSLHGTAMSEIQFQWSGGATDDREEEDEHGGDILDEPQDEDTDREPSLCGITFDAQFANGTDDGEPTLAGLGGTATGCEGSQETWSDGDNNDREQDTGCRPHKGQGLWQAPGEALSRTRDLVRRMGCRRSRTLHVMSPSGAVCTVTSMGRR